MERQPKGRGRLAAVLAAGAGIVLAGLVVRSAFLQNYPLTPAEPPALLAGSDSVRGHRALAALLADPKIERDVLLALLGDARAGLAAAPLDAQSMAATAYAFDRLGQHDKAMQAMELALRRDPRDLLARYWLIGKAQQQGRNADLVRHLDALMRLRPRLTDDLAKAMVVLAKEPGTVPAFADALARRPLWSANFLDQYLREAGHRPAQLQLLTTLAARDRGAVAPRIVGQFATALLAEGRADDALAVYRAFYPQGAPGAALRNPRFADALLPPPFDWTLRDDDNGYARLDGEGAERRLEMVPERAAGVGLATQVVALTPGRWRVAIEGVAGGTPQIALRCVAGQVQSLGSVAGRSAAFDVPARCPLQELALGVASVGYDPGDPLRIAGVTLNRAAPGAAPRVEGQ